MSTSTQAIGYHDTVVGNIRPVTDAKPLPVTMSTVAGADNKATVVRGSKIPASTSTPEALAGAGTYVQSVTIWAQKARSAGAGVANSGSVFIDNVSGDNLQQIELIPGAFISFTAPPGKVIDLADIYVDAATLNDGVFYLGLK